MGGEREKGENEGLMGKGDFITEVKLTWNNFV